MSLEFKNRLKSLLWRTGMMAVAAILSGVAESLNLLEISPEYIALLGLVLGEVSKWLNNQYQKA